MTISQLSVGNIPKGKAGQPYGNPHLYHLESHPHGAARVDNVWTVTAGGATNSQEYKLSAFGEEVSFTSDGTATVAEIADGLAAAANANPILTGVASFVSDGTDEVTIEANYSGIELELAVDDGGTGDLTLAEATAADDGGTLAFGVAVVLNSDGRVVPYDEATHAPADLYGISVYTYDEASRTVGDSSDVGYRPGQDAIVMRTGRIYVAGAEANSAERGDDVHLNDNGAISVSGGEAVTDGTVSWLKPNVIEIKRGF